MGTLFRKGSYNIDNNQKQFVIVLSDETSKSGEWKGEYGVLEAMDEMAIGEKEMKLLMNLSCNIIKDHLILKDGTEIELETGASLGECRQRRFTAQPAVL